MNKLANSARALFASFLLVTIAGCEETEFGNPSKFSQLTLSLELEPLSTTSSTGTRRLRDMWLSLDSVLVTPCDQAHTQAIQLSADRNALSTDGAELVLDMSLPADTHFCEVTLIPRERNLDELKDGTPRELGGRSLLLRADLSDEISAQLVSRTPGPLSFRNEAGFSAHGPTTKVQIRANLGEWLSAIELSAVELDADVARISETENVPLYQDFQAIFVKSMSLSFDDNGDGVIDSRDDIWSEGLPD